MKLSILDLHGQHDLDLDLQKNAHFFLIFVVFFLSSLFFSFLSSFFLEVATFALNTESIIRIIRRCHFAEALHRRLVTKPLAPGLQALGIDGPEITVTGATRLKSKHTILPPDTKIVTSSNLASGPFSYHPQHRSQRRRHEKGRRSASG